MATGERIKMLRTQLGMSQTELGNKVGVKTSAIYKYENGLVVNLKRSTIDRLAEALGTTGSYLMGYDDQITVVQSTSLSDPTMELLAKSVAQLNAEGRSKLIEYADDLVSSGKYKKYGSIELDQEA